MAKANGSKIKINSNDLVRFLAAVIIFLATGFIGLGITRMAVDPGAFRQVFRLAVLPACAFAAGFLSLIILRQVNVCLASAVFSNAIVYLVVMGFSFAVLLWNLLYIFSALMGLAIAYIVLTHKEKGSS